MGSTLARQEKDRDLGMVLSSQEHLYASTVILLLTVFTSASVLSVKCSADLAKFADRFPSWFVPLFVVGIAAVLGFGTVMLFCTWRARSKVRWATGPAAVVIWILIPISFICTSSVHGFYPFRLAPVATFLELDPILKLNLGLTMFGFLASVSCGVLYARGKHQAAVGALLGSAVFLLVPNDACKNPFNEWWLASVGASPLMFVPNLFAIVLGAVALAGVHRRVNTLALAAIGTSVGLLGLGHIFRVIW